MNDYTFLVYQSHASVLHDQHLTGAAIYAVPDVGGYVQGLKAFYELTDNGPMSGRALFSSHAYQKYWRIRFIIASVEQLLIENSGDGWDRRCLPLVTKARTGIEDPQLGSKLSAVKGEIISWALAMDRTERDRYLLQPSTNEQIMNVKHDAAICGDPVRSFIDLCLRPTQEPGVAVENHQLHSWFNAFCQQHGYQNWGMNKFVTHLKSILPNHYVSRRRATVAEDQERRMIPARWSGITTLPGAFVDLADTEQSDSSRYQDPQWQCIKSKCREGGLMEFEQNNSPSPGGSPPESDGSGLDSTFTESPDPSRTTMLQQLQHSGSGRSLRSGLIGLNSNAVNDEVTQEKLLPTDTSQVESLQLNLISPTPLLDLSDPNPESSTATILKADQDLDLLGGDPPDPNHVPDPNLKLDLTTVDTKAEPVAIAAVEPSTLAQTVVNSPTDSVPIDDEVTALLIPNLNLGENMEPTSALTPSDTPASTNAVKEVDEWLTPESTADLATSLQGCYENDSPQVLADIRQIVPNHALLAAAKLLSPEVKAQIKRWVVEQNQSAIAPQKTHTGEQQNTKVVTKQNTEATIAGREQAVVEGTPQALAIQNPKALAKSKTQAMLESDSAAIEESNEKVVVEPSTQEIITEDFQAIAQQNSQAVRQQEVQIETAALSEEFHLGDRVWWSRCPGHCAWANPFTIRAIEGEMARIDLYAPPVPLSELRLYTD